MCSVIGYQPIDPTLEAFDAFGRLFDEGRIRGTHAYGLAFPAEYGLCVAKSFNWCDIPPLFQSQSPTIAHSRYCQSGDYKVMENNQPLAVGSMALAMNGVIHMGTQQEYETEFCVTCTVDNDSEIFIQRVIGGQDPTEFIESITGSFAATWLLDGKLYAGRNAHRPLWQCEAFGARWFASTRDIFLRAGFPEPTGVPVGVMLA